MAVKHLRGAFVQFVPTFLLPIPNVIVFQYNPETMSHSWKPAVGIETKPGEPDPNPLAVRGVPGESFSFTLMLDSRDTIADGTDFVASVAEEIGVYPRLAALELLMFPVDSTDTGLIGSVTAALTSSSGAKQAVPANQLPIVLFVWGLGRILPVRVTDLSVTEKLFDTALTPVQAEAQVTLQVLTPDEAQHLSGLFGKLAKGAYEYTQALRKVLAAANQAGPAETIIDLLPM